MIDGNRNWFDPLVNQTTDITTEPMFAQILDMGIFVYGAFDGAEVKIQISPDDVMNTELYATPNDAKWFDHAEAVFDDETYINADFSEAWFRVVQSGSGLTTDITMKMRPRVEKAI